MDSVILNGERSTLVNDQGELPLIQSSYIRVGRYRTALPVSPWVEKKNPRKGR